MPHYRLFVLFALLSSGAYAQWLNYPTPGTPRTPDGKPNLAAPAPRTASGKPDLSGVWHVQPTSLAEWKRLLGNRFDTEVHVRAPGMELDNISKYALNILIDFKPEEAPMRPEATEIKFSTGACRATSPRPAACLSASPSLVWSPSRIRWFSRPG
jgi:hypothetical protein